MKVTVQYEIEVSEKKLKALVRKDMRELRKSLAPRPSWLLPAKAFYESMEPLQTYITLHSLHNELVKGGFSAAKAKYPTLVYKNYGNILMHFFPSLTDFKKGETQ